MKRIETRKEMLYQAAETATQLMNRAAELPEDTSKIVYTFADGWTIRQPQTWQDLDREGQLMGNCLEYEDNPDGGYWYDYNERPQKPQMSDPQSHTIYSLRDPQNIPHVTLNYLGDDAQDAFGTANVLGRHNSVIKPEYYYRFIDAGFVPKSMITETELDEDPDGGQNPMLYSTPKRTGSMGNSAVTGTA